jgi:hypothetical protein
MKLYKTEVTYQNFGTSWLIIIKGKEDDIEQTYNSLYNWQATGMHPHLDYRDAARTVATCWTNQGNWIRYCANIFELRHDTKKGLFLYVREQLRELKNSQESFWDFRREYEPDIYSNGVITAEKPDEDFKDAVLKESFKDKSNLQDALFDVGEKVSLRHTNNHLTVQAYE